MQSPPITVDELLAENRRIRDHHEQEIAALKRSLRDEFAMAALTGLLSGIVSEEEGPTFASIAVMAYGQADEMLKVRDGEV
jgi:hypothetical protein